MTTPCWAQYINVVYKALDEGDCAKAETLFRQEMNKPFVIPDIMYFALTVGITLRGQCLDLGIKACDDWLMVSPNQKTVIYGTCGDYWEQKGEYSKAIDDYTKSLESDPSFVNALQGMARILATCPEAEYRDGKKAVEYAEKLRNCSYFETLAAAYAENGQFPEAIQTQEKAIALVKAKSPDANVTEYEKRLASYKEGKPWRTEPPKTE